MYTIAKEFKDDEFDIVVDWRYEDTPIEDLFDPECSDIEDMKERCEQGIDTHYIARVRAFIGGIEAGSDSLGSCYAYDCDPEDDIEKGIGGYLDDMINEAIREAKYFCQELRVKLNRDFA